MKIKQVNKNKKKKIKLIKNKLKKKIIFYSNKTQVILHSVASTHVQTLSNIKFN